MTAAANPTPSPARPSGQIAGVATVPLHVYADERGRFAETFRVEWFADVDWSRVQTNRSDSRAGVLRGLHYHLRQVDYWMVQNGIIRVGLADLRPTSPTYRATEVLELDGDQSLGLFIPTGVAHGFVALTDATLIYVVNQYYDSGSDENGVAWDDSDLAVPWGVASPLLSPRDRANPRLRDIPAGKLPR